MGLVKTNRNRTVRQTQIQEEEVQDYLDRHPQRRNRYQDEENYDEGEIIKPKLEAKKNRTTYVNKAHFVLSKHDYAIDFSMDKNFSVERQETQTGAIAYAVFALPATKWLDKILNKKILKKVPFDESIAQLAIGGYLAEFEAGSYVQLPNRIEQGYAKNYSDTAKLISNSLQATESAFKTIDALKAEKPDFWSQNLANMIMAFAIILLAGSIFIFGGDISGLQGAINAFPHNVSASVTTGVEKALGVTIH